MGSQSGKLSNSAPNANAHSGGGHTSILDVIESVTSANFDDDVKGKFCRSSKSIKLKFNSSTIKDETVSESGSLNIPSGLDVTEMGLMGVSSKVTAPVKKTRRLSRVGVGGFSVRTNRQRTNSDKIADSAIGSNIPSAEMGLLTPKLEGKMIGACIEREQKIKNGNIAVDGSFDNLDEFDGNLISVSALTEKPPRRKRKPKQRGELEEVYPGYIQVCNYQIIGVCNLNIPDLI